MVSVAIGTAGAISAYFFGRAFSSYSVNEPDSVMKHLPSLPYFPWVFGCGLIFWLLVLLWPKLRYSNGVVSLHTGYEYPVQKDIWIQKDIGYEYLVQKDINQVAKLNTVTTTINMCGCSVLSARKVSLLVRYLFFFQMTSNLALLLICISWLIYKYTMLPVPVDLRMRITVPVDLRMQNLVNPVEGGSGGSQGSAVIKKSGDGSGGDAVGGGGVQGGGGGGGRNGGDPNRDPGGRGGGPDGGDPNRDPERGDKEMNNEPIFRISKITELTITVTAQTTFSLIGFHLTSESSLSKVLLAVTVAVQLVGFFCGLMTMLLARQNPNAAQLFEYIGLTCYILGHILMVALFVAWWLVLIITLLFGVVCIIFFRQIVSIAVHLFLRQFIEIFVKLMKK